MNDAVILILNESSLRPTKSGEESSDSKRKIWILLCETVGRRCLLRMTDGFLSDKTYNGIFWT